MIVIIMAEIEFLYSVFMTRLLHKLRSDLEFAGSSWKPRDIRQGFILIEPLDIKACAVLTRYVCEFYLNGMGEILDFCKRPNFLVDVNNPKFVEIMAVLNKYAISNAWISIGSLCFELGIEVPKDEEKKYQQLLNLYIENFREIILGM